MSEWTCEQSAFTNAQRLTVWRYWTNVSNHAKLEPDIVAIELDGPFETGTTGRTITAAFRQEWKLTDVIEGTQFGITGKTSDGNGGLSFSWVFEDEGNGTLIRYRIRAWGPEVETHPEFFRQMEIRAPKGLAQLTAALDAIAAEPGGN